MNRLRGSVNQLSPLLLPGDWAAQRSACRDLSRTSIRNAILSGAGMRATSTQVTPLVSPQAGRHRADVTRRQDLDAKRDMKGWSVCARCGLVCSVMLAARSRAPLDREDA